MQSICVTKSETRPNSPQKSSSISVFLDHLLSSGKSVEIRLSIVTIFDLSRRVDTQSTEDMTAFLSATTTLSAWANLGKAGHDYVAP